jgi:hypothetical protein
MAIGRGRWRLGRWWFYLDADYQTVGRIPGTHSVIYAALGVVAEHHRPAGYAARVREANYRRQIKKWQDMSYRLWMNSEWLVPQDTGESAPQWARRRWRNTVVAYELRAASARARGEDVPTIYQLTEWAPGTFGIPTVAHSGR